MCFYSVLHLLFSVSGQRSQWNVHRERCKSYDDTKAIEYLDKTKSEILSVARGCYSNLTMEALKLNMSRSRYISLLRGAPGEYPVRYVDCLSPNDREELGVQPDYSDMPTLVSDASLEAVKVTSIAAAVKLLKSSHETASAEEAVSILYVIRRFVNEKSRKELAEQEILSAMVALMQKYHMNHTVVADHSAAIISKIAMSDAFTAPPDALASLVIILVNLLRLQRDRRDIIANAVEALDMLSSNNDDFITHLLEAEGLPELLLEIIQAYVPRKAESAQLRNFPTPSITRLVSVLIPHRKDEFIVLHAEDILLDHIAQNAAVKNTLAKQYANDAMKAMHQRKRRTPTKREVYVIE